MEHLLTPEIVNAAINLILVVVSGLFGWASLKAGQYLGPAGRQASEIATNAALARLQSGMENEALARGWLPGKIATGTDGRAIAATVAARNPDAMATLKTTAEQLAGTVPGVLAQAAARAAVNALSKT